MIDQSIHFLDLGRWFIDDEIESVDGHETTTVGNPSDSYDVVEFEKFCNEPPAKIAIETSTKWGIIGSSIRWKSSPGFWGSSHINQITNFYKSLETGTRPDINAEGVINSQAMMCAIFQSAQEGRTIHLS